MSIARIGECRAKPGQATALAEFIQSVIVPGVLSSPGCLSCHAWQSHDDPTRFFIVEVWESVGAHQKAVTHIEPEEIERFRAIVAEMKSEGYFGEVPQTGRGTQDAETHEL
jgi:quinol monooxygenase YgiN